MFNGKDVLSWHARFPPTPRGTSSLTPSLCIREAHTIALFIDVEGLEAFSFLQKYLASVLR